MKSFNVIQRSYERVCYPGKLPQGASLRVAKQFAQDTIDALGALELGGQVQPKMQQVLTEYKKSALTKVMAEKQKFDQAFDKYRITREKRVQLVFSVGLKKILRSILFRDPS